MAVIRITDQQNNQVGYLDFIFGNNNNRYGYIFVDINVDFAFQLQLQECTLFNASRKAVASLHCGSNGKIAYGNIGKLGRPYPTFGTIEDSKVYGDVEHNWRIIGEVIQNKVRSSFKGIVGELFMNWESEDEQFYRQSVKGFADFRHMEDDQFQELLERLRPSMYQTMLNIAGGAALIWGLFEKKKRGWFR